MTPTIEQKLRKLHPWVYENVYFECDDGWWHLLDKIATVIEIELSKIEEDLSEEDRDLYRPTQIKEKWGGLRYYVYASTPEIVDAISNAENLSYKICETCGKEGTKVRNKGWIKVLCPEHREI